MQFSSRHRAGADPGDLGDGVRRAPGGSLPAPQPTTRNYSMPGSMPKPSATMDDGTRFRGSLPASGNGGLQPRNAAPLAPAPVETRREEPARPAANTKPVLAPEAARAQAEPEPAGKAAPALEPAAKVAPLRSLPPSPPPVPSPLRSRAHHPPRRRTGSDRRAHARAGDSSGRRRWHAERRERGRCRQQAARDRHQQAVRRLIARKPDREAIVALYQKGRGFQPLWVSQGAPSARAQDVIEYLRTIDADGLDPKDYPMPRLNVGSAERRPKPS